MQAKPWIPLGSPNARLNLPQAPLGSPWDCQSFPSFYQSSLGSSKALLGSYKLPMAPKGSPEFATLSQASPSLPQVPPLLLQGFPLASPERNLAGLQFLPGK